MKIKTPIALIIALVAGCSSKERHTASYNRDTYSSQTFESSTAPGTSTSQSTTTTISPTGSDTTLVTEVRQALMNDPTLAPVAPQIQINAANGIVTLSGTVKSEQEKTRIADVIRQTSGVVSVNNQLSVSLQPTSSSNQSSTTTSSPDQTSTTSPTTSEKSALSQSSTNQLDTEKQGLTPTSDSDRRNESERIYHSTPANQSPTSERSESRIYSTKPSDTTSSAQQSQQSTTDQGGRAGTQPSITGSEQGKSSFEANIQSTTATDRTLGQQIMQQLKTDTSLAAALPTIKLSINNGKVTLSGAAQSEQQKQQIESTVKRVSGVSSVENQIQVSAKSSTDTGSKSTTDTNP